MTRQEFDRLVAKGVIELLEEDKETGTVTGLVLATNVTITVYGTGTVKP